MSQEKFMNISALEAYQNKSFEEVRVDDYLKAYTATGKPPLPCPQHPITDMERVALSLPPLFQPYAAASASLALASTAGTSQTKPKIINPVDLPIGQEPVPIAVDGELYQSISCMTEYAFFSIEELRFHAYGRGHKSAPLSVKMDPFIKSVVIPSTASNATSSPLDPPENLQNVISQPGFADHSFEEFRVYYTLAGREVNSAEIRQFLGQPAVSPAPVAAAAAAQPVVAAGSSSLFSAPSVLGTPALAIQPKATPSFSFKF